MILPILPLDDIGHTEENLIEILKSLNKEEDKYIGLSDTELKEFMPLAVVARAYKLESGIVLVMFGRLERLYSDGWVNRDESWFRGKFIEGLSRDYVANKLIFLVQGDQEKLNESILSYTNINLSKVVSSFNVDQFQRSWREALKSHVALAKYSP